MSLGSSNPEHGGWLTWQDGRRENPETSPCFSFPVAARTNHGLYPSERSCKNNKDNSNNYYQNWERCASHLPVLFYWPDTNTAHVAREVVACVAQVGAGVLPCTCSFLVKPRCSWSPSAKERRKGHGWTPVCAGKRFLMWVRPHLPYSARLTNRPLNSGSPLKQSTPRAGGRHSELGYLLRYKTEEAKTFSHEDK